MPTWRKAVAAILDFIFVFGVGGYVIAAVTGNLTEEGFNFKGGPALLLFASSSSTSSSRRYLGGTIFQRLLGAHDAMRQSLCRMTFFTIG